MRCGSAKPRTIWLLLGPVPGRGAGAMVGGRTGRHRVLGVNGRGGWRPRWATFLGFAVAYPVRPRCVLTTLRSQEKCAAGDGTMVRRAFLQDVESTKNTAQAFAPASTRASQSSTPPSTFWKKGAPPPGAPARSIAPRNSRRPALAHVGPDLWTRPLRQLIASWRPECGSRTSTGRTTRL